MKKKKKIDLKLIKNSYGLEGYAMSDIKKTLDPNTYEAFCNFMIGQTVVPYIGNDFLVYKHDFNRFIYGGTPMVTMSTYCTITKSRETSRKSSR